MTDRRPTGEPPEPGGGHRARHRRAADQDQVTPDPPTRRGPRPGRDATSTDHGHGHGHGHGPAEPVSKQVKRVLVIALVPFALAAIVGVLLLYPFGHQQRTGTNLGAGQYPVNAEVVSAVAGSCTPDSPSQGGCVLVGVRMQDGPKPGQTIQQAVPTDPGSPRFAVGDQVVLSYAGANPDDPASYQVVDFQRGTPLLVLALMFAAAVIVLGRWQGFAALIALGLSFVVLIGFVLPAILAGENPLLVAVVGAGLIMFVVLYLTHGFSARTSTAVLGTLLSLALIGLLSAVFSASASLTGLDEDTSSLMGLLGAPIDARGLLLAGIVIGALGVLDDVTMTQTSAVWELRKANPTMSLRQLYTAGLRIGRDHVSSAVNTLVLAYAGAALPMLLAYTLSGRTFNQIVSSQAVAQEVVRTLVGSIGLVAAVPITTAIAAAVAIREPAQGASHHGSSVADRVGRAAATGAETATVWWRPPHRKADR
ncbi:YibE/F family protein [Saccharopolyspora phatthalungensis]|uniref:Putative membrane protein n=1 Tax=Saccharopolyspora phatthalungensis TaxID=664693 RepID=A0A840PYG3_9PSEU|nr:YibE/F family protein [Saccharopolyspora phatthalungensis]MBB5152800.1 putative membrane protein [Saccharopolyspora phatthalungensis]